MRRSWCASMSSGPAASQPARHSRPRMVATVGPRSVAGPWGVSGRAREFPLGGWHRLRRCSHARSCKDRAGPGAGYAGGSGAPASEATGGAGCAGVRGHARSHRTAPGLGQGLLLVGAGAPAKQATVGGTGCAGVVRGHARSYRDRAGPGAGLLLVVVVELGHFPMETNRQQTHQEPTKEGQQHRCSAGT